MVNATAQKINAAKHIGAIADNSCNDFLTNAVTAEILSPLNFLFQ